MKFLKIFLSFKSESGIFFFHVFQLIFFFYPLYVKQTHLTLYLINIYYKISRPPVSFLKIISIFSHKNNISSTKFLSVLGSNEPNETPCTPYEYIIKNISSLNIYRVGERKREKKKIVNILFGGEYLAGVEGFFVGKVRSPF